MASGTDNVKLNATTIPDGDVVAADNIGGVQHQRVKIEFGVNGTATDVSALNPLPVTGTFVGSNPSVGTNSGPAPTSSTQIAGPDGAGNLQAVQVLASDPVGTEEGIVTRNIPSGTQPVSLTSLPLPTGGSTSALQTTGNASLSSIDSKLPGALVGGRLDENIGSWLGSTAPTVGQKTMANSVPVVLASDQAVNIDTGVADKTAFTYGTSVEQPIGGVYQDTAPSLTAGTTGAVRLTANRAFHQNLRDASGNELLGSKPSAGSLPVVIASDQAPISIFSAGGALALDSSVTALLTQTQLASELDEKLGDLGQKTMAGSAPVVLASDQSAIPVTGPLTDAQLRATPVPISATALPLPTGAATEATLALIKAKTDNLDVALSTRAVTGLTDTQLRASAVPVSAASLPLPTGAATSANQTTLGSQTTKLNDGTNTAVVKAASTAAVATDPALVVAISPNNTVTVVQQTSATGTTSSVASSATNVTILASNTSRKGAIIYNDSTKILYLKLGTTASATDYTTQLAKDAYYEVPFNYTGRIDGLWASANGNARVTELT
jgi:hypothetical protein